MKNITIAIIFFLTLNLNAQDDKTVTLVVSGSGKTQDEAKQNALRSAIEQAFGTFISSKTEILNDSLVKDEIVSVASGNIRKFNIISAVKVSDDNFNIVLNATVSVTKLTSFAQSKGVAIEFDGEIIGLNIQQQILNEKNEIISMNNISNTCKSILNSSFDYSLTRGDAIQNKLDKDKWDIPLEVEVKFNKNIVEFKRYLSQSIAGLSMNNNEIMQYSTLGKTTYKVIFGDSSIGGSTSNIDYLKLATKNNPNIIFKVVAGSDTIITTPKLKAAIDIFKSIPEFRYPEIIFFDKSVNPILNFRTESAAIELIKIVNYVKNIVLNFKIDNGISSYSPNMISPTVDNVDKFGDFTIISDTINYIFGFSKGNKQISFPLNFFTSYYYDKTFDQNFSVANRLSLNKFDQRIYQYFCNRFILDDRYPLLKAKLKTLYNTKFGFVQIVDCLYSQTPSSGINNRFLKIPYLAVISMFDFKQSTNTILSMKFIDKLTLDELKSVKKYEVSRIEPVK